MNTLLEGNGAAAVMKFVIKGRTFDTATAKTIAIARGAFQPEQGDANYGAEQVRYDDVLYRTQRGAFFVHSHQTVKFPKGKPIVSDDAIALETPEKAVKWIEDLGAMIVDGEGLPLPPEAGAMGPSALKAYLAEQVELTVGWRHRKAAEFPDDHRNEAAAEDLRGLASRIKALPDDNAELQRLLPWYRGDDDDVSFRVSEIQSEYLRSYGFQHHDDDAADFLVGLALELENQLKRD